MGGSAEIYGLALLLLAVAVALLPLPLFGRRTGAAIELMPGAYAS